MKDYAPQQSVDQATTPTQGQDEAIDYGSNAQGQADLAASSDDDGGGWLGWIEENTGVDVGAGLDAAGEAFDGVVDAGSELVEAGSDLVDQGLGLLDQGIDKAQEIGNGLIDGAVAIGEAAWDLVMQPTDLVLSKPATEDLVAPWAEQCSDVITYWGHAFAAESVRFEGDAVLLRWNSDWGPTPVTKVLNGDDQAIDAKAAVGGMKKLTGWSALEASDQSGLEALIGGESNNMSWTARANLYSKWGSLSTDSAEDQATALGALLRSDDSKPALVDEGVSTAAAPYELAGPTEEADHQFSGQKADAEVWTQNFTDAHGGSLTIYAPKDPLEAGMHQHSVQEAADAAATLPLGSRDVVNSITLNPVENPDDSYWASEYNDPDFHSYMTAGVGGDITIYPDDTNEQPGEDYRKGTLIHETGHTWSYQQWGEDTDGAKWQPWKDAMAKDPVSVSGYADASIDEDVAETVQIYASTKDTPKHEEYRAMVPARFAILDREL